MSLAGSDDSISITINLIIQKLFAAGIHVVAAAGNNFHSNSCNFTPASSPNVITVGAIDESDKLTDFTNIGQCISIFAPGIIHFLNYIYVNTLLFIYNFFL
jgi:subtilisin family serine protease